MPAAPAQEHLLKLRRNGLSYIQISRACGVHPTNLGVIARGKQRHIQRRAANAILAVPIGWLDTIGDVPAIGATRRIRALYAIGISLLVIAKETGLSEDSINCLAKAGWESIDARRMASIRAAYDRLWMTPGHSVKNRYRAQREGWPGPLHWNDESIDDPNAKPLTDQDTQAMSSKDRHTEVLHLADGGVTPSLIAERVGLSESRVRQILYVERPVLCRHLATTSLKAPGMRNAA